MIITIMKDSVRVFWGLRGFKILLGAELKAELDGSVVWCIYMYRLKARIKGIG